LLLNDVPSLGDPHPSLQCDECKVWPLHSEGCTPSAATTLVDNCSFSFSSYLHDIQCLVAEAHERRQRRFQAQITSRPSFTSVFLPQITRYTLLSKGFSDLAPPTLSSPIPSPTSSLISLKFVRTFQTSPEEGQRDPLPLIRNALLFLLYPYIFSKHLDRCYFLCFFF